MNKNILNHFFLKKYNSVAADYTTYWRDIEKYTAMQQTKLCVTLLISIFTNLNLLTTGLIHIILSIISILSYVIFFTFLIGFINDVHYFKSDVRRVKQYSFLVDERIIQICKEIDKLPKYYYSGLFFYL